MEAYSSLLSFGERNDKRKIGEGKIQINPDTNQLEFFLYPCQWQPHNHMYFILPRLYPTPIRHTLEELVNSLNESLRFAN